MEPKTHDVTGWTLCADYLACPTPDRPCPHNPMGYTARQGKDVAWKRKEKLCLADTNSTE